MKILFTKQYRPANDLGNQQAVGEELAEYINHEYGLNNARIVGVRHADNPAALKSSFSTTKIPTFFLANLFNIRPISFLK